MADARMACKAPIEPKDIDAIVDYLISSNEPAGLRVALVVKHQ
jgi:hypothetical protein